MDKKTIIVTEKCTAKLYEAARELREVVPEVRCECDKCKCCLDTSGDWGLKAEIVVLPG
jgi:hypothetical protein